MNAFYVTVSIPILLVLAGFNHAHGLTTFGKPTGQGQGNSAQQSDVQGKHCTSQANCTLIKNTTCLRTYCLCGDNTYPKNGKCNATQKGAGHICENDEQCVDGAECQTPEKPKSNSNSPSVLYKTCQCLEDLWPTERGTCSGETNFVIYPGVLLISILLLTKVY